MPRSLECLKTHAKVVNNTAHMTVEDQEHIQIVELAEKGVKIELPEKVCAVGHSLTVDITVDDGDGSPLELCVSGKVENIEPGDGRYDVIQLRFLQYESEKWLSFCRVYSEKQDRLHDLFMQLKGVA